METNLTADELVDLVLRVFRPRAADRRLAVLIDLPDDEVPDTLAWSARRAMAGEWAALLHAHRARTQLETFVCLYRNVRRNNADLPETAWLYEAGTQPDDLTLCDPARALPFADVFRQHALLLAPTQFSATAPLKVAAKAYGFRAATMPGFSPAMIPALRLDYGEVNRRVSFLGDLLDRAENATARFLVDGDRAYSILLDLRHRTSHASGGLLPTPGTAGNLPSGETYIVPYEGEVAGVPSRTAGDLPVQFGEDVVVYRVVENRAIEVSGEGATARREAERLRLEPAYGNLAELGLGVLADFGVAPCGEVLLDEKLGLHIAFGRSEHFGGQVGPSDFSRPEAVVHIDRVYVPAVQPRVAVESLDLTLADGATIAVIAGDRYVVDFPR